MLLHALTPDLVNRNNIHMLILNSFLYMYIQEKFIIKKEINN